MNIKLLNSTKEYLNIAFTSLRNEKKQSLNHDNWLTRYIAKEVLGNENQYYKLTQKDYDQITTIELDANAINEIPLEIGMLSNLTSLNLNGNYISSIPEELCNLSKLEILYLNCNNIKSLPKNIGKLKQLTN